MRSPAERSPDVDQSALTSAGASAPSQYDRAAVHTRAIALASTLVATLYLVQLPGPLRLDTDSAWYLQIAASIADGNGAHPSGVPGFPPGLPLLLGGLDSVGLGTPWAFSALNICFLLVGLASAYISLRVGLGLDRDGAAVICLLTAVTALAVKYTMLPLSEIPFFGVANASVAALVVAYKRCQIRLIVAGAVLAALACTIRTAGVALLPALILSFATTRARIVAAFGATVAATAAVAINPRYLDELRGGWHGSLVHDAVGEARHLAASTGAAVSNVPISRMGTFEPILIPIGIAALLLTALVLVRRRKILGPLDGWVIGCVFLVYVWPSDHPRFILPVLPVLLGYTFVAVRSHRLLVAGWAVVLVVSGTAALAYSVSLSYSGNSFPERYAGGVLAPSYRVAWGRARPGDAALIDPTVVAVLRRYDPRHRAHLPVARR